MRIQQFLPDALAASLDQRLQHVDRLFRAELHSDLAPVNELASHVERFRGKMLRPTLLLLSAEALEAGQGGAVDADAAAARRSREDVAAAVVEMVHMATLVHDDILDEASVRRGGRTINALQGNEAAVMLGDYLISHAYHLCSGLDCAPLSRLVASTTNTVCEGELLQLHSRGDLGLSHRLYLEIVARKTASLTAACCRAPVVLRDDAAALHRQEQALGRFGRKVGIAFQMMDDVLDLVGEEGAVGKSVGRDLMKGKLTLPMVHWLESLEPAARAAVEARVRALSAGGEAGADPAAAEADAEHLRDSVRGSDAAARTRDAAEDLLASAMRQLREALPESEPREALCALAAQVTRRGR